jgi:hypothetical protein
MNPKFSKKNSRNIIHYNTKYLGDNSNYNDIKFNTNKVSTSNNDYLFNNSYNESASKNSMKYSTKTTSKNMSRKRYSVKNLFKNENDLSNKNYNENDISNIFIKSNNNFKNNFKNLYVKSQDNFSYIINKKLYDKVKISDRLEKIVSYIPYRSSIGKLFDHYEEYKIVDSSANLLFQHDLFTWHLLRNDFIYKEEVSPDSTYMDEHFKKLISNLDARQSETFVNSLFKVFYMTGSKTLLELVKNKGRILPGVVKLNKDEKVLFNDIILKGILSDARMRKILLGVFIERDNIK